MPAAATTIASGAATTAMGRVQRHAPRRSRGGHRLKPRWATSASATAQRPERLAQHLCGPAILATAGTWTVMVMA